MGNNNNKIHPDKMIEYDESDYYKACNEGNVPLIEYFYIHEPTIFKLNELIELAIKHENIEILDWISDTFEANGKCPHAYPSNLHEIAIKNPSSNNMISYMNERWGVNTYSKITYSKVMINYLHALDLNDTNKRRIYQDILSYIENFMKVEKETYAPSC